MQFVWLYIHGPDNGFELRHSIRSVIQNFAGEAKITVIGDKPDWYTGHHIHVARAKRRGTAARSAFLDTQNKIVAASNHPEIEDEFVWIMDDVYLLRTTSAEDLKVPRYDPWYKKRMSREWHRLIAATFNVLAPKGKTTLQYGTHLPHHFEKQKLRDLFVEYNYPKRLYLFEILYGNHFRYGAQPYGGSFGGVEYPMFLKRLLKRPASTQEMDSITQGSNVLNYQSVCFCKVMKDWLSERYHSQGFCE